MAGFRKAKAEQAALKIGMYGPPGSGKTFTSLLLAEGLANLAGKGIAVVDTERGTDFYCKAVSQRKFHPDAFDFDCLYTRSITEALAAVKSIDAKKYGVLILDSITHLWEAAIGAYEGKKTSADTIPMHAWGKIKKPYKELMSAMLSSPMHVIICGRQGIEYEEDLQTGELKAAGKKMKAEGETPYEPHILMRMEPEKDRQGTAKIRAFFEKDRTGVLAQQIIDWPNFENVCKPLLPLLGGTQAQMPSQEETNLQDAEQIQEEDLAKEAFSREKLEEFTALISLCKSAEKLKELGKDITPELKKQMMASHVTELREMYVEAERRLGGKAQGTFA